MEIKIVNCETGEEIVRDMTKAELKQQEKDNADFEAMKLAREQMAQQKQTLLERLGITEEEARLLLL